MAISRRARTAIVGGVFGGMLCVAAVGSYNIYTSLQDTGVGLHARSAGAPAGTGGATTAAPLTPQQIKKTADAFLAAWSSGDRAGAAALTDAVRTAEEALSDYASEGHIGSVEITPGAATPGGERFTVTAHISYQGLTSSWRYASALSVARDATGDPAVTWAPSVLHPALAEGDSLVTGSSGIPGPMVTDRDGKPITADRYPSLTRIIEDLKTRYAGSSTGAAPGVGTYIRKADGSTGQTLKVLKAGTAEKLRTTLDATVQAAAEKAVAGTADAGVTALDTRSGEILAIAYTPVSGTDWALQEVSPPGSTFKIVTAAALLDAGLTPSSPAPCRTEDNSGTGRMYHNDSPSLHKENATLAWDFAQSCNTGFIRQADLLGASGLRDTAARFGLTKEWNVGIPTPENQPDVPGGGAVDEMTSEMIGQGELRMSPLVMASVAATAATGHFWQPRIVAKKLITGPVVTAAGIPHRTSQDLRQMMRGVITTGTAQNLSGSFGPDSGAKTGTAEVAGQASTNGWFTAFEGHVSAAAVVNDAGHGNTSAGPIVAAVLAAS